MLAHVVEKSVGMGKDSYFTVTRHMELFYGRAFYVVRNANPESVLGAVEIHGIFK